MKKNYYELLGIKSNATQDEIKQAFRTMIKKYHPDVNPAPNADEVAAQIIEAYDVLSNPKERMKYDSTNKTTSNTSYQQPHQPQKTWQQQAEEVRKAQQQSEWQKQRDEQERKQAESAYNYYHYGKTREESESDFEDWIKEYIRRHRENKYYNLQKIEKYNNNDILKVDNNIKYQKIISNKYSSSAPTPNDFDLNNELDRLLADFKGKGINISALKLPKLKAIPPMTDLSKPIIIKSVENTSNDSSLEIDPKFIEYKKIYQALVQELIYDRDYVVNENNSNRNYLDYPLSDQVEENVRRTMIDKKGVCITFASRLSFELDKLGIENYLLRVLEPTTIHWVNMYFMNSKLFIADITDDIVQGDYDNPRPELKRSNPISYAIDPVQFFQQNNPVLCTVFTEENGQKIETSVEKFIKDKYAPQNNQNYGGKRH